jgi:DNA recombination protein RmuC
MVIAEIVSAAALVLALLALLGAALAATGGRFSSPGASPEAVEALARQLDRLGLDLARLGQTQEGLRRDVQQGREASLLHLSEATRALQGDIGEAQRALAEVKALEHGRAAELERAGASLRRLEAVLAGSATRGAAGENVLRRALGQLPPDLLETNVAFGSRVVEFALRLPGGRWLPVDSKWTGLAAVEALESAQSEAERQPLEQQVARDLRGRAREVARYLDPERTLGLALLAVPDAAYQAAPTVHAEAYRLGVLLVPYSLALPYLLAVYRLSLRLGATPEAAELGPRLRELQEALARLEDEIEGRLSRALVQATNARDALRSEAAQALRTTARLVGAADEAALESGAPAPLDEVR